MGSSASSRSGRATTARSADLPGLRLPVTVSARRAQAPKRVAIVSSRGPPSVGVVAVEEADLVEDAQARRRGEAVGAEADDHPALEHRAERVRGVAEPGVRPRAVGDRHALAVGGGLGAELPELGGVEVGAVRDQPVGPAQVAAADVVGRARADRLPVVVPGAEVFEERPEPAAPVRPAAPAPRASRPGGSTAAGGSRRRGGRASRRCCRGRAGSGRAASRRRPGPRAGPCQIQSQASWSVWRPRIALRPISSAKTTARTGARRPAPSSGRRSSCRPPGSCRPRSPRTGSGRTASRRLLERSARGAGRSPGGASRPRPRPRPLGPPAIGDSSRCVCALTNPGVIADVAQVDVGVAARRAGRRADPAVLDRQEAVGDRRPLDREDVAGGERHVRGLMPGAQPRHGVNASSGTSSRTPPGAALLVAPDEDRQQGGRGDRPEGHQRPMI